MKGTLRTAGAALLFLAGSLALAVLAASLFGVPQTDLLAVAKLLGIAGGGGGLIALLLIRPAVLGRLGGVRAQLVGAGLIGNLLLLGMMLAGARAMFISGHDLALLLTMLTFAVALSVGFGLLYAMPLSSRIERVRAGTERIAGGEFGSEVSVEGHDELAGLARDFNQMARALEKAAEREREMEQARRDLVAAVSHDLRTPLASTRAMIEALADGVASDPQTETRYLASASRELEHLSRLVDDLFELARIDAGVLELTLEKASLHDLISDTISGFQPQAEQKGIHLLGEVSGDVDPVLANPPRLQRVLHNLVSNALRHTPPDGTVALRAATEGNVARVEVSDTGEGIAAEDLPRVFEPSFRGELSRTRQGKDDTPGAGLGLAIARGLVEAHGGTMHVESEPGQGSRFRFTIERAR
jgi:signal transduction histidine kinase